MAHTRDPQSWKEFQETVLREHKRRYLMDLLSWAQGSVPEAAKAAGLSRQRFYILLREHGIMRQWDRG
jgi:transcriptional regulator of acetoin/glycerol metabolism